MNDTPAPSAKTTPGKPPPITVGWRERVALPDFGIRHLKAKIDTGARTSALHVAAIEELPDQPGRIRFEIVARESRGGHTRLTRWVEADLVREAVVKPSSGQRQRRPVIRARLKLAGRTTDVELTLVSRKGMLCRMLVGRTALVAGHYLVDPSRSFAHGNRTARLVAPPEDFEI